MTMTRMSESAILERRSSSSFLVTALSPSATSSPIAVSSMVVRKMGTANLTNDLLEFPSKRVIRLQSFLDLFQQILGLGVLGFTLAFLEYFRIYDQHDLCLAWILRHEVHEIPVIVGRRNENWVINVVAVLVHHNVVKFECSDSVQVDGRSRKSISLDLPQEVLERSGHFGDIEVFRNSVEGDFEVEEHVCRLVEVEESKESKLADQVKVSLQGAAIRVSCEFGVSELTQTTVSQRPKLCNSCVSADRMNLVAVTEVALQSEEFSQAQIQRRGRPFLKDKRSHAIAYSASFNTRRSPS